MSVLQNFSVLGIDGTELEPRKRTVVKASMDEIVNSVGTRFEEIKLEVKCPTLTFEEIKTDMVQKDV